MNTINSDLMEDPDDLGLQAVMGSKFQDKTKEAAQAPGNTGTAPAEKKPCRKVMDAGWVPVKEEPTERRQLAGCAKQTVMYGGISLLLFWWQQAGLLDSRAAIPSFVVLALLAGLSIGRNAAK